MNQTSKTVQGPMDKKSTMVEVIVWCQSSNKPLPESMIANSMMHVPSNL